MKEWQGTMTQPEHSPATEVRFRKRPSRPIEQPNLVVTVAGSSGSAEEPNNGPSEGLSRAPVFDSGVRAVDTSSAQTTPGSIDRMTVPAALRALLLKRHLIHGEDAGEFDTLLEEMASSIEPRDAVEWFWVKDIVDAIWEGMRLRQVRSGLFARHHRSILRNYMVSDTERLVGLTSDQYERLDRLVAHYLRSDQPERTAIGERLASLSVSSADVTSQALVACLAAYEQIDRLISIADARRFVVLRDIDRRRGFAAARFRQALRQLDQKERSDGGSQDDFQ